MSAAERTGWLPPRWVKWLAWKIHRGIYNRSGGRLGLSLPRDDEHYGTLHLTVPGRRTGEPRGVILGYFEDGPNLVTMAMNGWEDPEPAWWLNLQAHPDAEVVVADGKRPVRGRAAEGEERTRLWARWQQIDKHLDAWAARRSKPTAVVILEPR
ncbi:nitroreductase/quinone reductase family protein [Kribbella solani]|uniref:Deazaflavin-dependent oxidoreductase (Nitroreductase family) n=1 Tax=Kribbella solani TaxID=236067 RepID=A0A841E2Y3_9ACTN|nr:nitroreductase/quinone reductase family protein [Kribbella solani]MBB5983365.1 deazaflavin-dependent oxidoreductase (nitroreductase family) [Kribbella solani]